MARKTKRRNPQPPAKQATTKRKGGPTQANARSRRAKRPAKTPARATKGTTRSKPKVVRRTAVARPGRTAAKPSARRYRAIRAPKRLVAAAILVALLVPALLLHQTEAQAFGSVSGMRFGMDMGSIAAQTKAGVKPDYATTWVGPWTLSSGFAGVDANIERTVAADVTPVIQFYYWGDDISVHCVEDGCWSDLHHTHKDRAGWDRLATGLARSIDEHADGKPVVIILETEFNKGGISTYEPFDALLAEKARFFHAEAPNSQIVLGFGNWNSENWKTFDRAAAEADYVGIQGMRGSTRNSLTSYEGVVDATLAGVKRLDALFDRPVFLTDLALSSYPEPTYERHQARVLAEFFSRLPEFREAGLRAVVYRTWSDNPSMSAQNYFGEAERHWGLHHAGGADPKPAADVWIDGVKAARGADA